MKLSHEYSHVKAGWNEDDDDKGAYRDPELEEEFLSRDWPEVSQPLRGGKLKWKAPDQWMGKLSWSRAGGARDSGPEWTAQATDRISYVVSATRKFNEGSDFRDRIVDDFYSYEFDAKYVVIPLAGKKKKTESKRSEYIGHADTLSEAQKICEEHYLSEFA
jgi:hypothetical protein